MHRRSFELTAISSFAFFLFLAPVLPLASAQDQSTAVAEKSPDQETTDKQTAESKGDDSSKNASAKKKNAKSTIPVFTLGGTITESPQGDDPFFGTVGAESLKDLVQRLEQARDDEDVSAVVLLVEGASLSRGQVEEVRTALNQIRKTGKPVYGFVESLNFGRLWLFSACSHLSIVPTGDVMILGMYGEQPYMRGVLDKVHVTPDFLTCGDYKSAGETYTRYEPSPESKQMTAWLYDSLFETCVSQIADGRNVASDKVREWIDEGLFSTKDALAAGIVDEIAYRADFVKHIEAKHGDKAKFDKRYGKKKAETIDFGNPFAVFKIWGEILQGGSKKKSNKDAVGIVYVEGAIMPGKGSTSPLMGIQSVAFSTPIRKALDKVANDDSIKSVVLRVDSPGGSVVASEIILQATKRVAAKKPLVVSMGNVAGSGGYYVACGAETIFADACTITGSIGVVSGKLATRKLWDKVGVGFHPIQRGKNAGMLANGKVFTSEQRDKLQGWMDEVYGDFKKHVTDIRGDRLSKPIDEIAGGRVYTGKQALELGLVDRIGTLSDAIKFAAKKADLGDKYEVRIEPQPKSFFEQLMEESAGGGDDEQQISVGTKVAQWQTANLWKNIAPIVGGLEPHRLAAIQRAFLQLEILQREGVTLAMPEFTNNGL